MLTMNPDRPSVGLFAGVGGLELGLERAGFRTEVMAENYEPAAHVLRQRFPDSKIEGDVRHMHSLPSDTHLLAAGFPCQDLSSVGPKVGIDGTKSSLVGEVIRLLQAQPVPWVILENVPFIRDLDRGRALTLITSALEELGYRWAYRVVDARCFGLPQRRLRWFLVASMVSDPRVALLSEDASHRVPATSAGSSFGFYWTEGMRALGWAVDGIPPLKCGSTVGVASPPAILMPDGSVVTPDLRDAERLQGFRADWTKPAEAVSRPSFRWKLVGNAVSVRASSWLGKRIAASSDSAYDERNDIELSPGMRWPAAAWWDGANHGSSSASAFPVWKPSRPIHEFLRFEPKPLSVRASEGFLSRARKGNLRFQDGFLEAVEAHAARQMSGSPS